ncbi:MAG: DUF5711 family protein, partial [Eubacteriales bacterium]|nr:DUF5711 family protein [Eubacteriales bacterium]
FTKNKIIVFAIIFALFLSIIFNIFFPKASDTLILKNKNVITKDNTIDSTLIYKEFNGGILRISKDGISFFNNNTDFKWTHTYNMKNPIVSIRGNYALIADKGGNDLYLFNKLGLLSYAIADKIIEKAVVSDDGISFIIVDDIEATFIKVYSKELKEMDISIKSTFKGEGYPIDIAVSNDSTEIIVSYGIITNENIFTSKVIFYNFSEIGKNVGANRIVGSFVNSNESNFISKVHFFDNEYALSVYNGGLKFYSTKVLINPKIIKEIKYDKKIKSIDMSNQLLSIVLEDNIVENFDKAGNLLSRKSINIDYQDFYLSNNYLIFIKNKEINIYNKNLDLIFNGEIENTEKIIYLNNFFNTNLLVGFQNEIKLFELK